MALRGSERNFARACRQLSAATIHPICGRINVNRQFRLLTTPMVNAGNDDVPGSTAVPPKGNRQLPPGVQHFIHHLAPRGMPAPVLAQTSNELQPERRNARSAAPLHRRRLGGLQWWPGPTSSFNSTQIPVWPLVSDEE